MQVRRVVGFALALGLIAIFAPVLQAQPFAVPQVSDEASFDLDLATGEANTSVPCTDGDFAMEPLPDDAEGFTITGPFLNVSWDDLCRAWELPLREGVAYRHVTVEFDLYLDHWVTPIFHNITSLRRTSGRKNERILYYGLVVRGDNRRTLLDFGNEKQLKQFSSWEPGTTYHIVFDVDVPAKRLDMGIYKGEDLMQQMGGKLTAREIKNLPGKLVSLDFSSGGVAFNGYFPPFDSEYSNLKVVLEPF